MSNVAGGPPDVSFNTPTSSGAACARCSPSMLRATVADPPAIDDASITGGHGFARRHSPGFSIDTSLGGERAIYSTRGSPIAIGQGAPGLVAMLVGRTKPREGPREKSEEERDGTSHQGQIRRPGGQVCGGSHLRRLHQHPPGPNGTITGVADPWLRPLSANGLNQLLVMVNLTQGSRSSALAKCRPDLGRPTRAGEGNRTRVLSLGSRSGEVL